MKTAKIATQFLLASFIFFFFFGIAFAQEIPAISEQENLVLDSDLDGLTDEGEKNIYRTDPAKPDTDGDGFFDGTEVLNSTDPLDPASVLSVGQVEKGDETPWAWYVSRATGVLSFLLLYVVIFLGLTIRIPWLNGIFSPAKSYEIHAWLSIQALVFALVHGLILIFDKFLGFGLLDVLIPFASSFEPGPVAGGIFGLYVMILLIVTSYLRRFMPQWLWRASHFLNIVLFVIIIAHALRIGTDFQEGFARTAFIVASVGLLVLFVINIFFQIKNYIQRKRAVNNQ